MKCLVAGGYGFIGRGVVLALLRAGHEVTGAGRDLSLAERLVPTIPWIYCDFNNDLNPDIWAERLRGFDVVVNCVGILQSDLQDDAQFVHAVGAKALFEGAETAGIKRLIHISATTLDTGDLPSKKKASSQPNTNQDQTINEPFRDIEFNDEEGSEYSSSKLTGEHYLEETSLNWTIIRPDLVLGGGSIGGASLIQGLAGVPFILPLPGPGTQAFQPIALDDLADGIVKMIAPINQKEEKQGGKDEMPFARQMVYAVGAEIVTLKQLIQHYRSWLGFSRGVPVIIPRWVMRPVMWIGDLASMLGNRSPIRSAALEQMDLFKPHDGSAFRKLLGRPTLDVPDILALHQSTSVERQFARCYFLLPLLRWALGLSWIFAGTEALQNFSASFGPLAPLFLFKVEWQSYSEVGVALLTILCGVMFVSRPWLRVGGAIKSVMLLWAGGVSLQYVTGVHSFMGWALSLFVPLLIIMVLMGMHEKR